MGDEEGVGVDPAAAEQSGAEVVTLAQRYAGISRNFQAEMSLLSDASCNEMVVANSALDYAANVVGQLTRLQENTRGLGANAVQAGQAARQADRDIATGLASSFAS